MPLSAELLLGSPASLRAGGCVSYSPSYKHRLESDYRYARIKPQCID